MPDELTGGVGKSFSSKGRPCMIAGNATQVLADDDSSDRDRGLTSPNLKDFSTLSLAQRDSAEAVALVRVKRLRKRT